MGRKNKKRKKRTRMISPRLFSGESRETFGHGLPPAIKQGLRDIARIERKSMAWVLEEVIIRYFHMPKPVYKKRSSKR